jgi:hypothetical protein
MEDEMTARHTHLESVLQIGNDLISAGNFGADKIQQRIDEINQQWDSLMDLAAFRKKRLNEAVDFYQVGFARFFSNFFSDYLSNTEWSIYHTPPYSRN